MEIKRAKAVRTNVYTAFAHLTSSGLTGLDYLPQGLRGRTEFLYTGRAREHGIRNPTKRLQPGHEAGLLVNLCTNPFRTNSGKGGVCVRT